MRNIVYHEGTSCGRGTYLIHVTNAAIETFDQYITDLKTKAKTCKFGDLNDGLIRDQIVCGIICDRTRRRLFREADLTLQKAIDICRANEATTSQMKSLSASGAVTEPIDLQAIQTESMNKQACKRCGGKHNKQQSCPAIGAEYQKCRRKNHFARVCHTRMARPNLYTIQHSTSADDNNSLFIGGIQRTKKFKD